MVNTYNIVDREFKENRQLDRCRGKREDDIKTELKK
jgi:hypothetical protein